MKFLVWFLIPTLFGLMSFADSETMKGAKKDYESFKQEMTVKLDQAETKLTELKNNVRAKGGEAKDKTIAELEATRDQLKTQLNELEKKSKKGWTSFKRDFASSVSRLNTKIQNALKE